MNRMEIRLAGSGGQGVILATIILAEAAIEAGKYTAQSQSYGPEARGGSCKAEILISDDEIGYTKVQNPTFFMALTQDSLEKYARMIDRNCIILVDSSLKVPEFLKDFEPLNYRVPKVYDETTYKIYKYVKKKAPRYGA